MKSKNAFFLLACGVIFSASGSISVSKQGCVFHTAAGSNGGELYVAEPNGNTPPTQSLSRMILTRNASGQYSASLAGLVPERAFINRRFAEQKQSLNPLYQQYIGSLSTYNNMPLVAHGAPGQNAHLTVHSVALVQDIDKGSAVLTNTGSFNDALGQASQNIVRIVGGSIIQEGANIFIPTSSYGFVFAAVTPSDAATFAGQAGAGIAVAQIMSEGIVPIDTDGGANGVSAAALTHALIKIDGTGTVTGINDMCWNEKLRKLYVALSTNGGGVAVVVGSFSLDPDARPNMAKAMRGATLTLAPCVTATGWNTTDYIVADKNDGLAIQRVDVMNTSTGRDYLVVVRDNNKVYALPLTSSTGLLAQKNNYLAEAVVGTTAQLLVASDAAAYVAGASAPDTVSAMHVYGDTVFISCDTQDAETSGVFCSQALFDRQGAIIGWSSWERARGCVQPTVDFCQDRTGRMKVLSGDFATVYSNLWGRGEGGNVAPLVAAVNTFFPSSQGGVQSVVSVHNGVNANWHNTVPQLENNTALLAIAGRNRCALALTKANGTRIEGVDALAPQYLATYDLAAGGLDLGMLSTIAVSCSDAQLASEGWVFVGSMKGVAVLRKPNGDGFGGLEDLTTLADDAFSFKVLKKSDGTDFRFVSCIVTDENYFYVVCADGVYRCSYSADAFKTTNPDVLVTDLIATPASLLGASYQTILSMVIVNDNAFLATSKGLWVSTAAAMSDVVDGKGASGWREVTLTPGGTDSLGVCAQLSFVPGATKAQGGMLHVLTADISFNVASVYRISISNAVDMSVVGVQNNLGAVLHTHKGAARSYMTLLGQLREYFYTDGGLMIDASSQHHQFLAEGNGALRQLLISPSIGLIDAWAESVQPMLSAEAPYNTISGVVREVATGALIVPGSWGVQILQ